MMAGGGGGSEATPIALVCGTRPELIKLAPLIRRFGPHARVIYTGQHYDASMYARIRKDLGLLGHFHELGLGGSRRGTQLGRAVASIDALLAAERPAVVVVQGDTTSALAGALAANANEVFLVHVEAGLRSYDRAMPEEHNRVLIDHLSDLCCAPTEHNRRNLLRENVSPSRITVTGNTIVEAVADAIPGTDREPVLLAQLRLTLDSYAVATFHRPENVDDQPTLEIVLRELVKLPLPVVLPLHPRTSQRIAAFGLNRLLEQLRVVEPLTYPDFLALMRCAAVIISDSGGVQEEVSVLKRPIVVVRRSTERPEIEGTFGTLVPPGPRVAEEARRWLDDVAAQRARLLRFPSPYGDGSASMRVAEAVWRIARQGPERSNVAVAAGGGR